MTQTAFDGLNGHFVDHCDESGNLVTYYCDTDEGWTCSGWECYTTYTVNGKVGERTLDCAGTCHKGTCESRCKHTGDLLEYGGPLGGGQYLVKNLTAGWSYRCELVVTTCPLPPIGTQDTVDYTEGRTATCMGKDTDALGFQTSSCVFLCHADPPEI